MQLCGVPGVLLYACKYSGYAMITKSISNILIQVHIVTKTVYIAKLYEEICITWCHSTRLNT